MKTIFLCGFLIFTTACAGIAKSSSSAMDTQLKVTSVPGRLKAKLVFTNASGKPSVIEGLSAAGFKVETLDGKSMPFKGSNSPIAPVSVLPGQSVETAFNLQDSYPFWDRRTRYKIWYEDSQLKTNVVQVWF